MSPAVTATNASASGVGGGTSKFSRPSSHQGERPRSLRRRSTQTLDVDKKSIPQGRPSLREGYEEPASNREDWWRSTIKETPVPGAYEIDDFLKESERGPVKLTYNFKSEGRKRDPNPHRKGDVLLPGAYKHYDFLHPLDKKTMTYNFKSTGRDAKDFLNMGVKDKDVNVSPEKYPIEKYLSCSTEKQPSKHFFFRSQVTRFPTKAFKPKEGPAPGAYPVHQIPLRTAPSISSSFKSKTPRFSSVHTKVPGPGSYEKTYQSPMPATITKMGRQHGLFFASAFQ